MLAFSTVLALSSIAPMELDLASRGSQGGGLAVYGTATLTNTNVYSNQASGVCSPFPLPKPFYQCPYGA